MKWLKMHLANFRKNHRNRRNILQKYSGQQYQLAANSIRRQRLTPEQAAQADADALASDWAAVGNDLQTAMDMFDSTTAKDSK